MSDVDTIAMMRVRFDRARENIDSLDEELKLFRDLHPNTGGTHLDVATGVATQHVESVGPDTRHSVLAGEILYLMRSTLDHLVVSALTVLAPSGNHEEIEKSAFPICPTKACLQSLDWRKKYLRGVTDAEAQPLRDAITAAQPCELAAVPALHPLALLDTLQNIDKHRHLIRAGFDLKVHDWTANVSGGQGPVRVEFNAPGFSTGARREELVRARGVGNDAGIELDANVSWVLSFKLPTGHPVEKVKAIKTLREIHEHVAELVERLGRRFLP